MDDDSQHPPSDDWTSYGSSQPSVANTAAQIFDAQLEPWKEATIAHITAMMTPINDQLVAAQARIIELEKLADERNGRIVYLEENRDELECQVLEAHWRLGKANAMIAKLGGADN